MKKLVAALLTALMLLTACFAMAEEAYTNEDAGIAFTAPEGWQILSAEELAATLGVAADSFDNEKLKETLATGQQITIMMAMNETGSSVNINAQQLDASSMAALKMMGEKFLLEQTAAEIGPSYAQMGLEVTEPELGTMPFAGTAEKDYMAYFMNVTDTVSVLLVQVFFFGEDTLYTVTISAMTDEDLAAAVTAFAAL